MENQVIIFFNDGRPPLVTTNNPINIENFQRLEGHAISDIAPYDPKKLVQKKPVMPQPQRIIMPIQQDEPEVRDAKFEQQRKTIQDLYQKGKSIEAIAEFMGLSVYIVAGALNMKYEPPVKVEVEPKFDEKALLITKASAMGMEFDKRWGVDRLKKEIAKAEKKS